MAEHMLFAEELAEIIGVAAGSIKMMQWEANKARREGTADEGTFPEPAGKVRRSVPRDGRHPVTVMSNQWRASDVAAWIEHRPASTAWPEERRAEVAARLRSLMA